MNDCWRSPRAPTIVTFFACMLIAGSAAADSPESADERAIRQIVAVGIVRGGQAVVLATPGLPHRGRLWRFRSFDTSDLRQPIRDAVLSASGTKLFVQPEGGPGGVLDLTRQYRHNAPLQYVTAAELAFDEAGRASTHRLPAQRFVSVFGGTARVVDDLGRVQSDYPAMPALDAAIAADGAVLYLSDDGVLTVCGPDVTNRGSCRQLSLRLNGAVQSLAATSVPAPDAGRAPRFVAVSGEDGTLVLRDPEENESGTATSRTEASLRSCLMLHRLSMTDAGVASMTAALVRESADTSATDGQPIADWRFFRVAADEELYAPVLEFARRETVNPSTFGMLEELSKTTSGRSRHLAPDALYDRYLRLDVNARRERCTFYYRTHSTPGSWIIEYWMYYPFDVGGLGSHPHDPEHIFVEVDKLGGAPRRVIGAGHGYMAGNNVFSGARKGARAIDLPLFAIVELGKHASAPDIDRDGVFTPGIDENEYDERAKVWGVRDVIGTINNQLLAYDTTMSGARRPAEYLALAALEARFPDDRDIAGRCVCRLQPIADDATRTGRRFFRLSDWILLPPCHDLTSDCAKLHVTAHPDFIDVRTILKEWSFPSSFLRMTYGFGPRRGMHTLGMGYAMDLDRIPVLGRVLPLPGRIGLDGFYWRQDVADPDLDSCMRKRVVDGFATCDVNDGLGWGVRYEQFLSNLFGIFSAVRLFSPPTGDMWVTFGPLMEVPIGRRSNVLVAGGLSFRPYSSPRFELKVSVGLWKPKTSHVGVLAGPDGSP